jgi:hypothetical protein
MRQRGGACAIEGNVSLDGAGTKSEDCQMDWGTYAAQSLNGQIEVIEVNVA